MGRFLRDVTWLAVLVVVAVAVVAVVVAISVASAWRWVLAPLLGVGIWLWASSTLRSMVSGRRSEAGDEAEAATAVDGRTLYWCEECGTELLLVTRGSGTSPRHCGTRMHERTEVLH